MSTTPVTIKSLTNESQIEELLKLYYNLEVNGVTVYGKTLRINSDLGDFALKKIKPEQKDNLKLLVQLYEHMGENGEAYFPVHAPRMSTEAKPYFNGYHGTYTVFPWIKGKPLELKTSTDWMKLAATLATFHSSTKQFRHYTLFPKNVNPPIYGEYLRKSIKDLRLFEASARLTPEPVQFDLLWLENFKYIDAICDDILAYYKQVKGDEICRQSLGSSRVCYGNIRERNLLMTENHELRMLDWEAASLNLRIHDVKDLLVYAYGRTGSKTTSGQDLK